MPDTAPDRKRRFNAALQLAGITIKAWTEQQGVSQQHLSEVLLGRREPGLELAAAIDETISRYLPDAA